MIVFNCYFHVVYSDARFVRIAQEYIFGFKITMDDFVLSCEFQ